MAILCVRFKSKWLMIFICVNLWICTITLAFATGGNVAFLSDCYQTGWVCMRSNDSMNIDYNAHVYASGLQVEIVETKTIVDIHQSEMQIYKIRIGNVEGWVFEKEINFTLDETPKKHMGTIDLLADSANIFDRIEEGVGDYDSQLGVISTNFTKIEVIGYCGLTSHVKWNDGYGFIYSLNIIDDEGDDRHSDIARTRRKAVEAYKGDSSFEKWTELEYLLSYGEIELENFLQDNPSFSFDGKPSGIENDIKDAVVPFDREISDDEKGIAANGAQAAFRLDSWYLIESMDELNEELRQEQGIIPPHTWVVLMSGDIISYGNLSTPLWDATEIQSLPLEGITIIHEIAKDMYFRAEFEYPGHSDEVRFSRLRVGVLVALDKSMHLVSDIQNVLQEFVFTCQLHQVEDPNAQCTVVVDNSTLQYRIWNENMLSIDRSALFFNASRIEH